MAQLCAGLPPPVLQDLIAPLCVAALNTPASQASAQVSLRVLRNALFSGRAVGPAVAQARSERLVGRACPAMAGAARR
ncbi:hypothetical protein ACVBEH_12590 [Roseateles sp. GG27B]